MAYNGVGKRNPDKSKDRLIALLDEGENVFSGLGPGFNEIAFLDFGTFIRHAVEPDDKRFALVCIHRILYGIQISRNFSSLLDLKQVESFIF